jgi:hypothetical protein
MPTAKEEVRKLLDELPEEASYEDIQYHIYVREKVEKGLRDARDGRVVTEEELEERTIRWFCSFCGKSQEAWKKLVSSPKERPGSYICDECIRACAEIVDQDERPQHSHPVRKIPVWLVRMLGARTSD